MGAAERSTSLPLSTLTLGSSLKPVLIANIYSDGPVGSARALLFFCQSPTDCQPTI